LADWREDTLYTPSSFTPDGSALAVTKGNVFHLANRNALLLALDRDGGARMLARQAAEPIFSPDGTQVVFVRYSILPQREVLHKDLYVMNTDGTAGMLITDTPSIAESYPSWDPSGQRIAFNSFRISKDPIDALFDLVLPIGNSIIQINADGSCRQKLLSLKGAALYGASWRPGPGREAGRIEC
jgi:Tol biopolymer transport system component